MQYRAILAPCALASALFAAAAAAAPTEPAHIGWDDLRPVAGEDASGWADAGATVEITGYLLPVDREDDLVYEFLLVPRAGACSHVAQPPPDQVVRVVPIRPYRAKMSYEAVSVTGLLKAGRERTQLFIMDGVAVVDSGYSLGRASVAPAAVPAQAPERTGNPWRFMRE